MKSDVSHLPGDLSKIPPISNQLKMDEISTLSKLAQRGTITPTTHSVITHATSTPTPSLGGVTTVPSSKVGVATPPPNARVEKRDQDKIPSVRPRKSATQTQPAPQYPVAYATTDGTVLQLAPGAKSERPVVQLASGGTAGASGSGIAVQTADGLIIYSPASTTGAQYATLQQSSPAQTSVTSSNSGQGAYALSVPAYVDGQPIQLVPVSGNQTQVVYWPSVVQPGQGGSQTFALPSSQLAMMQSGQTILQPVLPTSTHHSTGTGKTSNFITID